MAWIPRYRPALPPRYRPGCAHSCRKNAWLLRSAPIVALCAEVLDILVNNMVTYALSDLFENSDADWQRMLDRGHGRVIFISSEVAITPMAAMVHYSASKATQLSISRSLAELTKGTNVTVNSVLPGPTETESLKGFISSVNPDLYYAEAEKKFMAENRPSSLIHRLAKPHEVANVVAFLASERGAVINGAAIRAEGGTVPTIA